MYVDYHTKRQVYIKMRKFIMFITAVCVLFFEWRKCRIQVLRSQVEETVSLPWNWDYLIKWCNDDVIMTSAKYFDAFSLVVTRGHSKSLVVTRGLLVVTRGHSCVLLDTISEKWLVCWGIYKSIGFWQWRLATRQLIFTLERIDFFMNVQNSAKENY